MKKQSLTINRIPSILWGAPSEHLYIAVHGKHGNKEEAERLAEKAGASGFQTLSFDLPEHGGRTDKPCTARNCVAELQAIGTYTAERWKKIALFANSIGAYFSLLAYKDTPLEKALFLSPILDMERLIKNMMKWSGVTEEELRTKGEIPTQFGETLSWPYYSYVRENPVAVWTPPTAILYGTADNLTEREVLDAFARRFHCDVTTIENGEHWFHTEEQIACLDSWLDANMRAG